MKLSKYLKLVVSLTLGAWLGYVNVLTAQDLQTETTQLTLTPAMSPLPAMRYELLPKAIDRVPGNAVVHYGKVKSEQNIFFSSKEISDIIQAAEEKPLSELKSECSI